MLIYGETKDFIEHNVEDDTIDDDDDDNAKSK